MNKWNKAYPYAMLLLSLSGISLFYFIPYAVSFFYSIWENPVTRKFCGLKNYVETFQNPYFLNGLKNTALFIGVSLPLNLILPLLVALAIRKLRWRPRFFCLVFLIPFVIPSATSAFFWKNFFGQQGVLNKFLHVFHIAGVDWLDSRYSIFVMVVLFLWKNIGYNMVIDLAGLRAIPDVYYECASAEGAGAFWQFRHITLVYLTPTGFFVLIMSFVNSFKVFREIYMITGEYPSDSLYVLQHYMNQMFGSLNYPKLTSAAYIVTAVVVLFVVILFHMERGVEIRE